MSRSLEELEALKARLQTDIRRSTMIDPGALTHNSPIIRNLKQVQAEIAELNKPKTAQEVISG